jgi:uncharacterized protein (DUF169 family)
MRATTRRSEQRLEREILEPGFFRRCGEEIEKVCRPSTFPLAVKLAEKEADIPSGAVRPKRDMGDLYSLCQGLAMSRREGKTIAMLLEDMWCPEAIICFGLVEPPNWFLEGRMNQSEGEFQDLRAARNYANSFARFEPHKYVGVISAPYMKADFEPDLLMVYGNPTQIDQLIDGIMYRDGVPVTSTMGGGACVRAIIPTIRTGRCQIITPCGGDHRYACAQDDELIFTVPRNEMQDLVVGLGKTAGGYPTSFAMKPKHYLPAGYIECRRQLGLDQ